MRILDIRLYFWIISLVCIVWMAGTAAARTAPAASGAGAHDHGAAQDPAQGERPKAGGGMCPMMSGGMMRGMGAGMEQQKPEPQGFQMNGMRRETFDLMESFHAWIHDLSARRKDFDLTSDQVAKLDAMISGHYAFAIRVRAEIQALNVELNHLLRTNPDNIAAAEAALRRIGDQHLKLQMEGVRLYGGILQSLSEAQKNMVMERIGAPFPSPWNDGSRAGRESPGDPAESRPEGEKPGGHAGHG